MPLPPLPGLHAGLLRRSLAPAMMPALYRVVTATAGLRVAEAAARGDSTISLTGAPLDYATAAGDTFSQGATVHTISAAVELEDGILADVPFGPALGAAMPLGTALAIQRSSDLPVQIIARQLDGSELLGSGTLWAGGDFRITVFGLPADFIPIGDGAHRIIWGNNNLRVKRGIGHDPVAAGWTVQAAG